MKKYDCVFSMGEACLCASILDALNLRHFSAPFDWLYGATFEERMNLFLNDFENFLNQEDLEFYGQRDNPEPRDIYFNHQTKICLNHDFPLNVPLEKSFSGVKAKYNRRISRLFLTIKKSKNVLMVFMELPNSDKRVSLEKLKKLMAKVNKKFFPTKVDILYIKHNELMKDGVYTIQKITPTITVAECFNRIKGLKINYTGNLNNVKSIFSDIYCPEPYFSWLRHRLRKWGHELLKIFYRKRIKNGETYYRVFGIKVKCRRAS